MKEKLTKANSELSQACSNEVFGDKFTTSIETFCHTSPLNTLINNKMSETMNEFSRRGLSDRQAAMSLENIKTIIPAFNGESAFSVIDAFDTYRTKLSQSGISRTMWGNIVLTKISGEARSRISIPTQRNPDIDEIEKQLIAYYGDSLKVSELIMMEHKKAGEIPDPHNKNGIQATLRILQLHSEVLDYAERFLALTEEETAESNMVSGTNIQILLNLLPQRVRVDIEGMSKAVLDEKKRKNQYEKFKKWVLDNKQILLTQGVKAEETNRSEIALVANNNSRQMQQIGRAHV